MLISAALIRYPLVNGDLIYTLYNVYTNEQDYYTNIALAEVLGLFGLCIWR